MSNEEAPRTPREFSPSPPPRVDPFYDYAPVMEDPPSPEQLSNSSAEEEEAEVEEEEVEIMEDVMRLPYSITSEHLDSLFRDINQQQEQEQLHQGLRNDRPDLDSNRMREFNENPFPHLATFHLSQHEGFPIIESSPEENRDLSIKDSPIYLINPRLRRHNCQHLGVVESRYFIFPARSICIECAHQTIWELRAKEAVRILKREPTPSSPRKILAIISIFLFAQRHELLLIVVQRDFPDHHELFKDGILKLRNKKNKIKALSRRASCHDLATQLIAASFDMCSHCFLIHVKIGLQSWTPKHNRYTDPKLNRKHSKVHLCHSCLHELNLMADKLRCSTFVLLGRESQHIKEQRFSRTRINHYDTTLSHQPYYTINHTQNRPRKLVYGV